MKKPTKTKAVKAVKYWAAPDSINLYRSRNEARYFSGFKSPTVKPVALIPTDAASFELMVQQAMESLKPITGNRIESPIPVKAYDVVLCVLDSIGIKGGAK